MFLLNSLTIVILFAISLLIPITGFLLPVYKIQKLKVLTSRQRIIVDGLAILIIGVVNPIFLIIYLLFFTNIEIFYHIFNKVLSKVKKFDRIVATTIFISCFAIGISYFFREDLAMLSDLFIKSYRKNTTLTLAELKDILHHLKSNAMYYVTYYVMTIVYFVYMSVDAANYKNWKSSFEWLLIYIIPFFMIHVLDIDNFYTRNIMEIGELIFTFFGIKTIFAFLSKYSKINMLNNLASFIIAMAFPHATFIFGVLGSYWNKDIEQN